MNSKCIELDMKDIYSMNEILSLYSSRRGPMAGYAKRKKAVNSVINQMRKFIDEDKILFDWPSALLFEWHVPNGHRDPDNISSGGRKAIFDGWQKTPLEPNKKDSIMFLPNDNHKHLRGFIDKYIYDKQDFVRIYQIDESLINNISGDK